jgi:hypothetical protein
MKDSTQQPASPNHSEKGFEIRIGDTEQFAQVVVINDPKPTGRQIILRSNRRPEKDFQLFLLTKDGELEEVGLDETVSLRDPRVEQFFVFRSDRVFYFVIDDRRFPWGEQTISESALKFLARVPAHYTVWQDRDADQAPLQIEPGSTATLSGKGVEVFKTGVQFNIQIDRNHYKVTLEKMTGLQLRNLPAPPISSEFDLFEVVPGGTDRKIGDDQVVEIRNGLRFFTAPANINPGLT